MTRQEAHDLVDKIFNLAEDTGAVPESIPIPVTAAEPVRVLPQDKRVVRTKTSGDRVYELDEVSKTRSWLTNEQVLTSRGWEQNDVLTVEEDELLKYQMGPAIYRAES